MNKQVDMQAFVGVDFDCEFFSSLLHRVQIDTLGEVSRNDFDKKQKMYRPKSYGDYPLCRPRLNKPQVLDDWSFVPDGLVWRVTYRMEEGNWEDHILCNRSTRTYSSSRLRGMSRKIERNGEYRKYHIESVACIGAEPDYIYWANAHGVPVVG